MRTSFRFNLPLYRAIRISIRDVLDASNTHASLIVAPAFSYRPSLRLVIIALLLGCKIGSLACLAGCVNLESALM